MERTAPKKFYKHKISNLLNVQKIVTVHYQELSPHYVSEEEAHDFWEIIYADKGNVFFVRNGREERLSQGEIAFIQPNAPHFVKSGKAEPNIFIVSFECRSESMNYFVDKRLSVPENLRYLLQNVMSEALATFRIPDFDPALNKLEMQPSPNLGGEQVLKNSLELLLVYLLRMENERAATQKFFVSKAEDSTKLQDEIIRYLSSSVYGEFSLDELCEKLHYGKTFLCSLFKRETGNTIYQTYLKMKTDEAKKLIRRGKSFSEIADLLHFDTLPHFIGVFGKCAGMTPGEYRNSIKK